MDPEHPWIRGVRQLERTNPLPGWSAADWLVFIDLCHEILATCGDQLAAMGWDENSVFGLDPVRPRFVLDRPSLAHLLLLRPGAGIMAISAERIVIEFAGVRYVMDRGAVNPAALAAWRHTPPTMS